MGNYEHKSILDEDVSLRRLELRDAEPMLEWMLEPGIYEKMQYDPKEQSIERCQEFIQTSWVDENNHHYAITNETQEYLGTVSLKNIDNKNKNAEFAIALHPKAMGKGISAMALQEIMEKAFDELKLHKVYLYVRSDNKRAIAFYEKNQLKYEGCFEEHLYVDGEYIDLYWYALRRGDFELWRECLQKS